MKKALLLVFLCVSLTVSTEFVGLGPSALAAPGRAEIEKAIRVELMDRHPKEDPEWWRSLGAETPSVIIQMYGTVKNDFQRLRLIEGLGYFDDPAATEFLKRQASTAEDDVVRNGALRSIGKSPAAGREIDFVARFLKNPDPQTRVTAATALQKIQDPRAQSALDSYLKTEKSSWIVAKLRGQTPSASPSPSVAWHPELIGEWKGYWISPEAEGLRSESAVLVLKKLDPSRLQADLKIQGRPALPVESPKGDGNRLSGLAQGLGPFQGEMMQQDRIYVLRLNFPAVSGTLVLRKIPRS